MSFSRLFVLGLQIFILYSCLDLVELINKEELKECDGKQTR